MAALKRPLRAILAAAAVLVVAGAVILFNLADLAVRSRHPALLAALAPVSPRVGELAAEISLAGGNAEEAERLARQALASAPLSARALRVLALARQQQGRGAEAASAMSLAAGLGWRDTPTQLWLLAAYTGQGDYAAALERADAMARRGQQIDDMMAVMMAAAAEPQAQRPLVERLETRPPWRPAFFDMWRRVPAERAPIYERFMAEAARGAGPLTLSEVAPFTAGLFQQREHARAAAVWRRFGGGETLIHDGGFERAEMGGQRRWAPFLWSFPAVSGIDSAIAASPAGEGKALFAASDGNVRAQVASQSLVLAPGRYRLVIDAKAEEGSPADAFTASLGCAVKGLALSQSEPVTTEAEGWSRFVYMINVPAGCSAQTLSLQLRSLQPRPIALWFDNIAVTPAG